METVNTNTTLHSIVQLQRRLNIYRRVVALFYEELLSHNLAIAIGKNQKK